VYERGGDNAYLTTFRLVDGEVDGTSDTDGIEVTSASLGPDLPSGLFVAQDGSNSGGNQNYKLVRWRDIAEATEPMLALATGWDPRGGGGARPERDGGVRPGDEDGGVVGPGDSGAERDAARATSSDADIVPTTTMSDGCNVVGRSHPTTVLLPVFALLWLARRRRAP
jgi:uncharacterized protein (TIGR03382 family)